MFKIQVYTILSEIQYVKTVEMGFLQMEKGEIITKEEKESYKVYYQLKF
jgi:hypothetical protein